MQEETKKRKIVKEFILKHRFGITSLIIILSVIFEIIISILFKNYDKTTPFIEIAYYTSQILSSFFVISGVVIAVWQYYVSYQTSKNEIEIMQIQKAIDLSEYYKDNILKYHVAIDYLYDNTGITDILKKINPKDMKNFDLKELNQLLCQNDIEQLKKIQKSEDFLRTVLEINQIYNLGFHIPLESITDEKLKDEFISRTIVAFAAKLITNVLNNMEYFALHFSHYTADNSVVYQSLHQTYLQLVQLMYYRIAKSNDSSTNKYYTNVIWLYNEWNKILNKQETSINDHNNSILQHGNIVKNSN